MGNIYTNKMVDQCDPRDHKSVGCPFFYIILSKEFKRKVKDVFLQLGQPILANVFIFSKCIKFNMNVWLHIRSIMIT
jgi:hypothetical protein